MKNNRPPAAVRPTPRRQKYRPSDARRPPDSREAPSAEQQPERKGPRRTLTIVFRAN